MLIAKRTSQHGIVVAVSVLPVHLRRSVTKPLCDAVRKSAANEWIGFCEARTAFHPLFSAVSHEGRCDLPLGGAKRTQPTHKSRRGGSLWRASTEHDNLRHCGDKHLEQRTCALARVFFLSATISATTCFERCCWKSVSASERGLAVPLSRLKC